MQKLYRPLLIISLLAVLPITAFAQDAPPPGDKVVKYSPFPEQNYPNNVFFGDTHLHTSYSTDAGMVGNIRGPEDAYRLARGGVITSSHGLRVKLSRPLDFLVISDHAENLGLAPAIAESNAELLKNEWPQEKNWRDSETLKRFLPPEPLSGGDKVYPLPAKPMDLSSVQYELDGKSYDLDGFMAHNRVAGF